MSYLHRLVDQHIRELSGAEFKIAAYLYRCLEHEEQIAKDIETFAKATGVSWRQTQSALQSLARKGILQVNSTPHRGTSCRLPAAVKAKQAYPGRKLLPAIVTEAPQVQPAPPPAKSLRSPSLTASPSPPKPTLSRYNKELLMRVQALKNNRLATKAGGKAKLSPPATKPSLTVDRKKPQVTQRPVLVQPTLPTRLTPSVDPLLQPSALQPNIDPPTPHPQPRAVAESGIATAPLGGGQESAPAVQLPIPAESVTAEPTTANHPVLSTVTSVEQNASSEPPLTAVRQPEHAVPAALPTPTRLERNTGPEPPMNRPDLPSALSSKENEIRQMVRALMTTTDNLTAKEFNTLLLAADGDRDILLARLKVLLGEFQYRGSFGNFMMLCAEVRRMVWVR